MLIDTITSFSVSGPASDKVHIDSGFMSHDIGRLSMVQTMILDFRVRF